MRFLNVFMFFSFRLVDFDFFNFYFLVIFWRWIVVVGMKGVHGGFSSDSDDLFVVF